MIIRAIPEYKPLHTPNISKHILNIPTPKISLHHRLHKTKNELPPKSNYTKLHIPLELIT
jgi:hypothetical protein